MLLTKIEHFKVIFAIDSAYMYCEKCDLLVSTVCSIKACYVIKGSHRKRFLLDHTSNKNSSSSKQIKTSSSPSLHIRDKVYSGGFFYNLIPNELIWRIIWAFPTMALICTREALLAVLQEPEKYYPAKIKWD
jgi:hypothetical protein